MRWGEDDSEAESMPPLQRTASLMFAAGQLAAFANPLFQITDQIR